MPENTNTEPENTNTEEEANTEETEDWEIEQFWHSPEEFCFRWDDEE